MRKTTLKVVCSALGCSKPTRESFCARHLKQLPDRLREARNLREAVTFLGLKDGYLTRHASKASITEAGAGSGREYV